MIKIERITKNEIDKLNNLLQLYLHDLSLYFPITFNNDSCLYEYDNIEKYVEEMYNYAYFIINDGNIIGFSLINENKEQIVMQEMFILNNYKKKGYGKEAVFKIFNNHNGNWIVKVVPNSKKAENFWLKTINEYTNGNYSLEHTRKYKRAEFNFRN